MPRKKAPKRKDGRYEIKRTVGHHPDGKPIIKHFYSTVSMDNAIDQFNQYMKGAYIDDTRTPFGEWCELWLETYKRPTVKPTTFATTYERPCKNYILPHFENSVMQDLKQIHIKAFLTEIEQKCSQSLCEKILICLNGIFESAVDNDLLHKNPCRNLRAKAQAKPREKRTFDRETVERLCSADAPYALYVEILLRMGLRCSELCGLLWENIDLEKGIMHIKQALTTELGISYIGETKSATSNRSLTIPEQLLQKLRSSAKPSGYLTHGNRKHMTPDHFAERELRVFYNALQIPEEKRLSPHELRHTCGTLLYEETKDIYFVSKFLGHTDISITAKTYVHSTMNFTPIHIDFDEDPPR